MNYRFLTHFIMTHLGAKKNEIFKAMIPEIQKMIPNVSGIL
jgi:hypothetical protein